MQGETGYLNLLSSILEDGFDKDDRTGVGTKSIFGAMLRFDLEDGFPLLTTKKVWFKGIVYELLWFLRGETNVKYLQDNNVHIWNEWADESGNLGPVYGKQWRAWERLKWVPLSYKKNIKPEIKTYFNMVEPDYSSNKNKIVGKIFNTSYGDCLVIKEKFKNNIYMFDVQFTKTGFISKNIKKESLQKGKIKDYYAPNVVGVGCLGNKSSYENDPMYKIIYSIWVGMLRRCYDSKDKNYSRYGGRGVFVDNRWLIFSNFFKDVQTIPGWNLKKTFLNNYQLDKDGSGCNYYSTETCKWISIRENSINTYDNNKAIRVTTPDGSVFYTLGCNYLSEQYGFVRSSIQNCLNGKSDSYKGYKFEWTEYEGFIPRIELFDQIHYVISEIKQNPTSRRILFSSWNVSDIERMALPPCHLGAVFNISNGRLNCIFNMRSTDAFLGLPFNIASYALLTMMIAHVTNLKPGHLIYFGGDVHIYNNHIEQVKEQLKREPFKFPTVRLNSKVTNIDNFRYEDIKLIGYKSYPKIKADIAV